MFISKTKYSNRKKPFKKYFMYLARAEFKIDVWGEKEQSENIIFR